MAMQKLDLEEQEKLDALKAWWKDNARLIVLVVVAAAIAVAGTNGWRWYQRQQALEASALYDAFSKALRAADAKAIRDAGGALTERYAGTLYASMAALAAAHFHFERGEPKSAKAQLQWVLERSSSEDFRNLARLRLAALLLDERAFDEALALLEEKPLDTYAAQFAALRGDLLVAKDRPAEARTAYQLALEKASGAFRESVQMRLDALGG
ncbi:MAG: tetratricopeptide repeat protein [Betaproteobacteria bacterium]|nr:tetratricopeptide repeat protein [Betaproteobacteria bacterium]MDH5577855.1 tetratricopeptide repeat protein [Betaproteobacteria bacterium]